MENRIKPSATNGCLQIHSGVERLGLGFGGRKEDNKQVLIVRDDRECFKFDQCNIKFPYHGLIDIAIFDIVRRNREHFNRGNN